MPLRFHLRCPPAAFPGASRFRGLRAKLGPVHRRVRGSASSAGVGRHDRCDSRLGRGPAGGGPSFSSPTWVSAPGFAGPCIMPWCPLRLRLVVAQMDHIAVRSVSIVGVAGLLSGWCWPSRRRTAWLASAPRAPWDHRRPEHGAELGPVVTAILVGVASARGSFAELGSMRVTEQIDAMRAWGQPSRSWWCHGC
jgi:hypothetical protein